MAWMNCQNMVLVKHHRRILVEAVKATFGESVVDASREERPFSVGDADPKVFSPAARRDVLRSKRHQGGRMVVS